MGAEAARDEAIRMLCHQNVATRRTHAREDTGRLAANRMYHASRIETKDI